MIASAGSTRSRSSASKPSSIVQRPASSRQRLQSRRRCRTWSSTCTSSASWPASRAPSIAASASRKELPSRRGLELRPRTFTDLLEPTPASSRSAAGSDQSTDVGSATSRSSAASTFGAHGQIGRARPVLRTMPVITKTAQSWYQGTPSARGQAMLKYSNTTQTDATALTAIPQRPRFHSPGSQLPLSRATNSWPRPASRTRGRSRRWPSRPASGRRLGLGRDQEDGGDHAGGDDRVHGQPRSGDSFLRRREPGSTSARANAHITREQLVWMASRLAVKPMMNRTNSGLVIPSPELEADRLRHRVDDLAADDRPVVRDGEDQGQRGVDDHSGDRDRARG